MGESVGSVVDDALSGVYEMSDEAPKRIAEKLYSWLANDARKVPLPDLTAKLQDMQKRIEKMSKELRITFQGDVFRVEALTSESDSTLTLLSRGSSWFVPHPGVSKAIIQCLTGETE